MNYTFELNVQLNGLGISKIPKTLDSVSFNNIEGRLHATTKIESRFKTKIAKYKLLAAFRLLEEAVTKLTFIYKFKISLSTNGYLIKKLFTHKYPYTTSSSITSRYSINVDHDSLADKLVHLKPEIKPVLNKALAYYQAALESDNTYVRTILMVSCISSIIQDQYKIRKNIDEGDLVHYLDEERRIKRMGKAHFKKFIRDVYKGRSTSAHRNIDLKNEMKIREIEPYYEKFRKIIDIHLEKFMDENKVLYSNS